MSLPVARVRIWARPKGNALRLLVLPDDTARRIPDVLTRVHDTMRAHTADGTRVSGFVFVCWDHNWVSTTDTRCDAVMPAMMLPDFVRNRLLASQILTWANQDVREMLGFPPSPA